MCLDARNINKYTIPQYEAPMNTEEIFGRITGSHVFSKVDLKHSFWLISLNKNCRDYTGFSLDGVVFRFIVVPYGLQSSCIALERALHPILNKYDDFIVHYVDDILVHSKDENSHKKHLEKLLYELDKAGLKMDLEKCQFFQEEIIFLGYKINKIGVKMVGSRIEGIMEYKRPQNLKT